jgi:transposase-like protein
MTISVKERERARSLYVVSGLTFEQVASKTGVAESTLKRWSAEEGWPEIKKTHYAASLKAFKETAASPSEARALIVSNGESSGESAQEGAQLVRCLPKASNIKKPLEIAAIPEFVEIRESLLRLLNSAVSKEEAKLQKQGAGVSPKVLSAVARLAEVTALYFQPPAE